MIPLFLLLVFLQILSTFGYDFASDLEKLKNDQYCDWKCLFDQPELTLNTMNRWPRECPYVCAILTLNQNTNIAYVKLEELFENMTFLVGGVRVENTSLTSLAFLPQLTIMCDTFGITISNNYQLDHLGLTAHINPYTYSPKCSFRTFDNPKLNTSAMCRNDYLQQEPELRTDRNKVDCSCRGGKMTSETFGKFINCEIIHGNLTITDISDPPSPLKVKTIYGHLIVKSTNLTNLSFLESVEVVEPKSNKTKPIFKIHDNLQLRTLGIKEMRYFKVFVFKPFRMSLRNLHPQFCITIDEMLMFMNKDIRFANIEGNYCKGSLPSDGSKMCVFEGMSSLESGCDFILGDILIESGDEDHVDKLKAVTVVFGSITVRNTKLEDGGFLKTLVKVASLNDTLPAIQFLSNKRLEKLILTNLQAIIARVNRVIFDGNGPDLFEKTSDCMSIQYFAHTNVTYNGSTCKAVNKTRENSVIPYDDNYEEDSRKEWLYEYEGFFYNIDPDDYQKIYDSLNGINDVTAVIGFIVNIFHLIVLFQKELRNNFIYIMMIGISVCDTLLVSTFMIEYALEHNWLYWRRPDCEHYPFYHSLVRILGPLTKSMTRRCSSLLAFSMALFRTCSVMFPMSGTVVSFSRPNVALSLVIGLFAMCILWDFYPLVDCEFYKEDYGCFDTNYTSYFYSCELFKDPSKYDSEDDYIVLRYKFIRLIDGFSTVTIGLLYLIVTVGLLIQLHSAQKRRRSLKSESTDNTSLLVTLMALTFFLSGATYGSLFIINQYLLKYFSRLQSIITNAEVAKYTLLIANSTAHCLICFAMSSQYRSAAKRVFWGREKASTEKSSLVFDMATISTVKTSKSSVEGRTF